MVSKLHLGKHYCMNHEKWKEALKCTFSILIYTKFLSLLESCLYLILSPSPSLKIQIKDGKSVQKSRVQNSNARSRRSNYSTLFLYILHTKLNSMCKPSINILFYKSGIFKHYKLKPSFQIIKSLSIIKDTRQRIGQGWRTSPHPQLWQTN